MMLQEGQLMGPKKRLQQASSPTQLRAPELMRSLRYAQRC